MATSRYRRVNRFIPVHTGNTGGVMSSVANWAVHPRAYGEHQTATANNSMEAGSSPCIRGTHDVSATE